MALAEAFVKRFCAETRKPSLSLTPEAIQAITTYTWPGNIRELENAMQRSVILCDNEREIGHEQLQIDLDLINLEENMGGEVEAKKATSESLRVPVNQPESHEDLSLEDYFQRFVLEHQDTMSETELARKLGVSRKCLWERRQRLGIPRKKPTQSAPVTAK